ncbi:MAG: hypothetical protein Q7Q71_09060 [Verrucomicrobiota bacterium JB023]|nr:hypothetical protein [Verrucomicrobiota bacterium JB023]
MNLGDGGPDGEFQSFDDCVTMSPEIVSPQFQNPVVDTAAYLMLGLPLFAIFFVGSLIFALPVVLLGKARMSSVVSTVFTALACIFVSGLIGHLYWSEFIWNEVYYSPDYVVDFWMFFPTTGDVMRPAGWEPGHLIGNHTEASITHRWCMVSLFCWMLAAGFFVQAQRYKKVE